VGSKRRNDSPEGAAIRPCRIVARAGGSCLCSMQNLNLWDQGSNRKRAGNCIQLKSRVITWRVVHEKAPEVQQVFERKVE